MTNVFHFTFVVKEKLPPQIVPKTYPEVSDFSAQLLYTVFCISVDDVFDREKTFQAQHRSLVAVKRRGGVHVSVDANVNIVSFN